MKNFDISVTKDVSNTGYEQFKLVVIVNNDPQIYYTWLNQYLEDRTAVFSDLALNFVQELDKVIMAKTGSLNWFFFEQKHGHPFEYWLRFKNDED